MDADVAIIGAGPAGSIAAAKLALEGASVVVLEKEPFPRFRIGESLLPAGNRVLQAVGVLEKVEAAGFVRKYGARFCDPAYKQVKRISFGSALSPVAPYTFQVERAKYDAILRDHAESVGARVQHGVTVTGFEEDAEGVTLSGSGLQSPLRVRWLLDAGGRALVTLRKSDRPRVALKRFNKRIAIYTHLANVELAHGVESGDTVAVRFEDGWVWIIPLDSRKTSVGLVLDASAYDKDRPPVDQYWEKLRRSPYLRHTLRDAEAVEQVRTTSDYSYLYKGPTTTPRILQMGDAFGFLDPIFSSGVHMAQSAGLDAAGLVVARLKDGGAIAAAARARYEAGLLRRATAFRRIIESFYDPVGFKVFLDPGHVLRLADAVTNIVAGDTSAPWPVQWRYQLFLTICRLQRHMNIVKSTAGVDLSGSPAG